MKIMIAVKDNEGIDSILDHRFGRAGYFMVYDTGEDKIVSVLPNKYKDEAQGVGIKVANLAVDQDCGAVIGPQPGPKALQVLETAGIQVRVAAGGPLREVVAQFKLENRGH